jgi:hypothetical protein
MKAIVIARMAARGIFRAPVLKMLVTSAYGKIVHNIMKTGFKLYAIV